MTFESGDWHLVTVVYDYELSDTTLTVYKNGILAYQYSDLNWANNITNTGNFNIGAYVYSSGSVWNWKGKFAEAWVYNRVITQEEVLTEFDDLHAHYMVENFDYPTTYIDEGAYHLSCVTEVAELY